MGSDVGEAVGGIWVGRTRAGLVGGRVEVTKMTGASVGISAETLAQAVSRSRRNRESVIFFVMPDFLRACKIDGEIASIGGLVVVGIPDAHIGNIGVSDFIAVGRIVHPPFEGSLRIPAAVDDL